MDYSFNVIVNLILACVVLVLVLEIIGDLLATIICAIIAIAVVGGIVYVLYMKVGYPICLFCLRFIGEHQGIFVFIMSVVGALVLLMILFYILRKIHRLLTTDYARIIHHYDRNIASATEALARAKDAEENYRRSDEFEILEPGRHKYIYIPNRFEQEVDQCEEMLNRLNDEKRYYEEQRRMGDKLRRWSRKMLSDDRRINY